jgi:hypothetical protein
MNDKELAGLYTDIIVSFTLSQERSKWQSNTSTEHTDETLFMNEEASAEYNALMNRLMS